MRSFSKLSLLYRRQTFLCGRRIAVFSAGLSLAGCLLTGFFLNPAFAAGQRLVAGSGGNITHVDARTAAASEAESLVERLLQMLQPGEDEDENDKLADTPDLSKRALGLPDVNQPHFKRPDLGKPGSSVDRPNRSEKSAGGDHGERGPASGYPEPKQPPKRPPPVSVEAHSVQRARLLDALFLKLGAASTPEDASAIAEAIDRVWLQSGSDTANLMFIRAVTATLQNDISLADALFTTVVELQPDWAEGWVKRGALRAMSGDAKGAIADFEHALQIEPRAFNALAPLGALYMQTGAKDRALDVFRRALKLNPQQPDLAKSIELLRVDVEGRDI